MKVQHWLPLAIFAPLSSLAQVTAPPSPTTITVQANSVVRTLDSRMYGVNLVAWDSLMTTSTTQNLVQAAQFGSLRFPGGSLADDYNWATDQQISNPTFTWASHVASFAQFVEARGAKGIATVNYGNGTPQMAAAMVAYLNASTSSTVAIGVDSKGTDWKTASYWATIRASAPLSSDDGYNFLRISHPTGFAIAYFEVGNENYGTWENDYHGVAGSGLSGVKWDPFTYAQIFPTFQSAMLAVDSTIHIGAPITQGEDEQGIGTHAATNPRTGFAHTGWGPVLLTTMKAAGTKPDFLIFHYYAQTPGLESDNVLLQEGTVIQQTATDLRQRLNDYLGSASAPGVELLMTELNSVYGNPGKQTANLVNGLFYADALGNIAQTEYNAALWWDLHNGAEQNNNSATLYGWRMFGCYDIITGTSFPGVADNTPLPSYYGMKLMTHWARGGDQIVTTNSNYTWLSAFGAKLADGTIALLVVNKNPTTDVTAQISVTGIAAPNGTATVYTYGKGNDAQNSATPDITSGTITNASASFSYSFPSYSMSVIQLSSTPTAASVTTQPSSSAVNLGDTATFSVVATGTGTISYQWYKDGVALSGQTSSTLTISNVQSSDFGSYTVGVSNSAGSATSAAATLSLSTAHLSNVSMRAQVASGAATPIVGIIVSGSGTAPILVRALGPALIPQGLTAVQALPDPALTLFDGSSTQIAQNNDWSASLAPQMAPFAASPLAPNSLDAAIVQSLAPGGYTVFLQANAGTGVGLLEMDSLEGQTTRLTNISARALVGTGPNVLIAGFIISGSGTMNVLVRGLGPTLTARGVTGVLADPLLQVYSGQTVIGQNDDWGTGTNAAATAAAMAKINASPLTSPKDSALVLTLGPGGYTVIVSGVGSTTGVALAEVYAVP